MSAAEIRFIDTANLPKGFDVADLVAQGITSADLIAWCKARLRPGYPPHEPVAVPNPEPQAKKSPSTEGVEAGAGEATTARERTTTIPARKKPSTAAKRAPVPAVVTIDGNLATIHRQAEPEPDLDLPPEYSEDSLADVFSARFEEELLYVAPWKRWMIWNGARWEHDETLRATDLARHVCREQGNEAIVRPDLASKARSIATALTSARTIGNVERLARSDRRMAASASQWDHDPWALNTPGGVVNLTAGTLRPARKDDFVTKVTSISPGGACPQWLNFLNMATDGDTELVAYLRRMAGYCLTGITREHAMFFVYGTGGNGKGTFLNTMDWILNSYTRVASMEMFVDQKFATNADAAGVASLMGARMVTVQEVEEGKRWNTNRLKEMTGGDTVTARFLHSNPFTYVPQFKLVFAGNNKPSLRNVDEAIRRRFNLIPFTVTVRKDLRDVYLGEKLKLESSGILQWAIEGCLDWQDNFLAPPERVQVATEEYFEEEDTIGSFMEEACDFSSNFRSKTSDLYQRYGRWCESSGEYTLPRKRWLQQLAHRNIQTRNIGGQMMIEGLRIKPSESSGQHEWHDLD